MHILIFLLLIVFVAANVWVEAINERDGMRVVSVDGTRAIHVPPMHWWKQPLSAYLHGVAHAWVQSTAYLGLALAFVLLIFAQPHGPWWMATLIGAAVGLGGVVVTANLHGVWKSDLRRDLHVACAGYAFASALVAECIALWHTPDVWFPLGAVCTVVAFARFAPSRHSLEEKAFTLWLIAGFVSIVGLPL